MWQNTHFQENGVSAMLFLLKTPRELKHTHTHTFIDNKEWEKETFVCVKCVWVCQCVCFQSQISVNYLLFSPWSESPCDTLSVLESAFKSFSQTEIQLAWICVTNRCDCSSALPSCMYVYRTTTVLGFVTCNVYLILQILHFSLSHTWTEWWRR